MLKRFCFAVLLVLVPAATYAHGSKPYLSLAGIPFDSSRDVVMSQMKANGYQYNYVSPQNLDDEPYSGSIDGCWATVDHVFNPAGKLVATLVSSRCNNIDSMYRHFIAVLEKRYGNPEWTKRVRNYIIHYWSPYDGKRDVHQSEFFETIPVPPAVAGFEILKQDTGLTTGDGISIETDGRTVKVQYLSPEWNAEVARRIEAGKSKI